MRVSRLLLLAVFLLLLTFLGVRLRHAVSTRTATATPQAASTAGSGQGIGTPTAEAASERGTALQRLAYAQAWAGSMPPAFAAFRDWTERFRRATPAGRLSLEAEGVALARVRRPAMRELIITDPQRALAITVPAVVRQILPSTVLAEIEARVAGKGDYGLRAAGAPEAGAVRTGPALWRFAFIKGVTYVAHAYGRREAQLAKEGASLHGIALDREMAVHESPLRVLEPGEIAAGAAADNCPVSDLAVAPLAPGAGVNLDSLDVVEASGRVLEFCSGMDMLEKFEQMLDATEAGPEPRVRALSLDSGGGGATPGTAADAATANTIGTKKVLVLRVDTSDFPGEPLSLTATQAAMDDVVKVNLETYSGGQTSVVSTVSPTVYRLPRTGASYALADDEASLHADAVTAASATYNVANFDRVVVLHPRLSPAVLPGSLISYGGEALSINGSKVLINGGTNIGSVTHELGHCYGLYHSNLWQVSDGNPLSAAGTTTEYGDAYDMMGSSALAFSGTRDTRHHFNPWQKNRAGWLPDSAVTTVTTSGTYRIYRFDTRTPIATQPLALRIFRDGVRWYWVGLRQSFTTNASVTNGACVVWGFNNPQQSQLLDLTTPGAGTSDAALAIGATLTDPVYGITIKPLARGGTEPEQYLDVEVTVPSAPPNVVTAWGRTGALFFSGNTGLPANPSPETYVPFGLTNVQAIAAGDLHALALKADGTLVVWGDNTNGQTTVPAGLGGIASLAAGGNISGVVKTDGTVQLWGEALGGVTTPPTGLTGVKQLAIGGSHSVGIYHALALKTDGTVVAWGDNTRTQATVPAAAATNVIAVAASDRLSVVLKADGTVVRWGTTFTSAVAFPSGLSGITAIASSGGAEHALALRSDGTVVAWGANSFTQATVPENLSDVVAIATGNFHSLALKADGTVVTWGSNTNGQLNKPASMPRGYVIACGARANFMITGAHLYLTAQPQAQNVAAGAAATLSVGAVGDGTLTYQWRKDGVAIPGATASTLTFAAVSAANVGSYDVIVRDGANTLTTAAAALAITVAAGQEATRISNLSILTSLASRTDNFRMGFVVGGVGTTGPKRLVIRAAGPSLGALGVPGTLGDPTVTLFTGATQVGTNDDWNLQSSLATAMAAVGAFPLVDRLDAVLVSDVNGRDNTVVVGSAFSGAPSGAVIAEIYDATPSATFTATVPRLINVSVLKDIGASLTAGFVIAGPVGGSKRVLIRAVGPGLAAVGVSAGFVPDPRLTLFGTNQAVVGQNDDWGGTAELKTAFNTVGAFVVPDSSKDAAVTATLQPGVNYTAVVTAAGGATGLVLVEVYEMP